jgi:hypothetical protein
LIRKLDILGTDVNVAVSIRIVKENHPRLIPDASIKNVFSYHELSKRSIIAIGVEANVHRIIVDMDQWRRTVNNFTLHSHIYFLIRWAGAVSRHIRFQLIHLFTDPRRRLSSKQNIGQLITANMFEVTALNDEMANFIDLISIFTPFFSDGSEMTQLILVVSVARNIN